MSEIVEGSVLGLQESEESEGKARKLSDFLKEEEEEESKDMDEIIERRRSRTRGKWRNLKERLGFKGGIGCCGGGGGGGGGAWGFRNAASDMTVREEEGEDDEEDLQRVGVGQIPMTENSAEDEDDDDDEAANRVNSPNVGQIPVISVDSRMNLATALAAERHIRAAHDLERDGPTDMIMASSTPLIRVSLMRLLEEGDGVDVKERRGRRRREEEDEVGSDWVCCVCMERRKGAAFIPCGHTFCRCCSRDLWLNRGSCPICNHSIVEILDIF